MKSWQQMNENERNELVAEKVLGWIKKENYWYNPSQEVAEKGPIKILPFSTDELYALTVLQQFDSYQITKMFPTKYRTIIQANKNSAIAPTLPESICKAALKVFNIEI
jgi:hypothetical protein